MAQLRDTLIQGSARVTDTLYANNININNILSTKKLIISSTTAEEHIQFSRTDNINYILFPNNTSTGVGIGYGAGTAYCPLIIQKTAIFPGGTTETINLGVSGQRWNTIYGKSGNFTGTVTISKSQDAAGTENNSPALIVGGTVENAHLELDGNEIMAKTSGTTVNSLHLNTDGGTVTIGENISTSATTTANNSTGLQIRSIRGTNQPIIRAYSYFQAASGYQWGLDHLAPNLQAGANTCILTGVANSSNNQGVLEFHYAGSNNADNYVGLGLYGNNG